MKTDKHGTKPIMEQSTTFNEQNLELQNNLLNIAHDLNQFDIYNLPEIFMQKLSPQINDVVAQSNNLLINSSVIFTEKMLQLLKNNTEYTKSFFSQSLKLVDPTFISQTPQDVLPLLQSIFVDAVEHNKKVYEEMKSMFTNPTNQLLDGSSPESQPSVGLNNYFELWSNLINYKTPAVANLLELFQKHVVENSIAVTANGLMKLPKEG